MRRVAPFLAVVLLTLACSDPTVSGVQPDTVDAADGATQATFAPVADTAASDDVPDALEGLAPSTCDQPPIATPLAAGQGWCEPVADAAYGDWGIWHVPLTWALTPGVLSCEFVIGLNTDDGIDLWSVNDCSAGAHAFDLPLTKWMPRPSFEGVQVQAGDVAHVVLVVSTLDCRYERSRVLVELTPDVYACLFP